MKITVVGAGAFGSWSAYYLQSAGHKVTLVDCYGPGNYKASSGGESRMLRGIYGNNHQYIQWTNRSLELWKAFQKQWNEQLYVNTGILWMFSEDDEFAKKSLPFLSEIDWPVEELTLTKTKKKYPQINLSDLKSFYFEPKAGFLRANYACKIVTENFLRIGGNYIQDKVIVDEKEKTLNFSSGSICNADQYIFCCGPWMKELFPEILGDKISPTRQEVFFFDCPKSLMLDNMPMWGDFGKDFHYGIPGSKYHGFKIANDARGLFFDPETTLREPSKKMIKDAQEFASYRFPILKSAKIIDSRVCQYENSPDEHLIIDNHPALDNLLLVGGGSGHGFKMGPAVGEYICNLIAGEKKKKIFQLTRFNQQIKAGFTLPK